MGGEWGGQAWSAYGRWIGMGWAAVGGLNEAILLKVVGI